MTNSKTPEKKPTEPSNNKKDNRILHALIGVPAAVMSFWVAVAVAPIASQPQTTPQANPPAPAAQTIHSNGLGNPYITVCPIRPRHTPICHREYLEH